MVRLMLNCLRCGWKWFPVSDPNKIKICPKCKSIKWNTLLRKKEKESIKGEY